MNRDPNRTAYLGRMHFREDRRLFGIAEPDRMQHLYMLGKTGTGKSSLIELLAAQDIASGQGVALIDPHGDLAGRVYDLAQRSGRSDVVYFDVPNNDQPFGYNPLRRVRADKRSLAASGLIEIFKKLWIDAWGPRLEHILRNAIHALLERDDATLPDVLRLLTDKEYRIETARKVTNEPIREFWTNEYAKYSPRLRADAISPIQSKVGALISDPLLRRVLTSAPQDIHFRQIMDEGGVLIVNLAKGQLGDDTSTLLGGLLVTTLALAAFSRADQASGERKPFYIYIDEFQNFTTLSLVNMASELRKYGVGLTLAHQHLHQLEPDIRHAVLANAGSLISFRLGPEDASYIAKEFAPKFETLDLMNLANHHIYLKLMIDGAPSKPFSAVTLSPRARERLLGL
jgi:type IV secretory pathway TraG/TraD family ATPase VirD4